MIRLALALLWFPGVVLAAGGGGSAVPTDVTRAGVVGDGVTSNTAAIQRLIDACTAGGGGTLVFPEGRYLTGTIQLKDDVTIRLEEKAVLLGTTDAAEYRNVDPFTAGDGIDLGHALVVADGARRVGIEGGGTIDGQGKGVRAAQPKYVVRPFLVRWIRCADVVVKDVRLANSGAWGMHFFQTTNATVDRVRVRSRGLMNNDGIDVDSCDGVTIRDCDIDTGDDAICLKATSPRPCRDVTVTGCTLATACNAIKLGTESLGDFERVRIGNCRVRDTGFAGIALFSVDGADLHDVTISDVTMERVTVPITLRLGSRLKTFRPADKPKPVGRLRDITLRNVRATGVKQIGLLVNGVPGHPVESLTLEDVTIEVAGGGKAEDAQVQLDEKEAAYPEINMFRKPMPAYGAYLRHAVGVKLKGVRVTAAKPDGRPPVAFVDMTDVDPPDFVARQVIVPAE